MYTSFEAAMREIDARVPGFDYTTFHAYTTEVAVDGRTWTLGIRYNTFYQFYMRLTALEKHFTVEFPPKGGLFFSPPPEERQEQLDDFLLSTLAYFDMRGHPKRMEALLGELLQIPEHMGIKDDDDERTASEGSSVAEDHDDFLEGGHEDEGHDDQEGHTTTQQIVEEDNQVEDDVEVDHEELKAEVENTNHEIQVNDAEEGVVVAPAEPETKPEAAAVEPEEEQEVAKVVSSPKPEGKAQLMQQQLTGGTVAKDYIAMLRRRTLVNGAIQAAVVSTMKENVEKSKAAKMEKKTEQQQPAEEEKVLTPVPVSKVEEQPAAPIVEPVAHEEPAVQTEAIPTKPAIESSVPVLEEPEGVSIAPEEKELEPVVAIEADLGGTPVPEIEQDTVAKVSASASASETEAAQEKSVQEDESSEEESEEADPEPNKRETESENPVVSWFRRMGTFGSSSAEKEEQEAAAAVKKQQEENEAAVRAEAEAHAKAAAEAEARAKAEAAAKAEATEAQLLRAEQELNLRLKRYRHPVFFQGFNCDVGTSRYSLPQRLSEGIVV